MTHIHRVTSDDENPGAAMNTNGYGDGDGYGYGWGEGGMPDRPYGDGDDIYEQDPFDPHFVWRINGAAHRNIGDYMVDG